MGKIIKYKIGIDEVGRGPVAGPVAVGGVFYDVNLEKELLEELKGMTDSKKLSEKKREIFFEKIKILKEEKYMNSKKIFSSVVFVSAKDIDSFGIVPSIQKALNFVLENILKNKELQKIDIDEIKVLLDGGLKHLKNLKIKKL
jgi:ribonuclease HII